MTSSKRTSTRLADTMKTAKVIAALRDEAQELAFAGAERCLQKAVVLKHPEKETFWRQVFADFILVVARRGKRDCIEWHKIQAAALYADGENPRFYSAPQKARADCEAAPEIDFAKDDDAIPF